MAGILANSATVTMVDGDTAVDQNVTGYLMNEQITLSVTGSPTNTTWGQAIPSGSGAARTALSSSSGATQRFTPDVSGYYTITCNADGTMYVLRIQVLAIAQSVAREALRLLPMANSQVPTPQTGIALFCGTDETLRFKDSTGTVYTVTAT